MGKEEKYNIIDQSSYFIYLNIFKLEIFKFKIREINIYLEGMWKSINFAPVSEIKMIRKHRNILTINEIQGLKGFETMTIAGTSSTYHTTISVFFRHKIQLTNIS